MRYTIFDGKRLGKMTDGKTWKKTQDWFWEGNVQNKIVEYIKKNEGFKITKLANPERKTRGPDILAEKRLGDGSFERRLVEVKGDPSPFYMEGERKGRKKRTRPSTQARHWFSEVLLELVLAKCKDENLQIALGVPDYTLYVNLTNRINWLRKKIGLFCYLVTEDGKVKFLMPNKNI